MQPEILYEDKDILAINKPAGLIVHYDGRGKEPTLVDWLILKYPKIRDVGEPWQTPSGQEILRSGIVHRLDRDTSGVLLVAKTQKGFECLKKQFQERTVKKEYTALVWGKFKEMKGTVDRPIARSSSDFRKWSAGRGRRGEEREAVTDYEVISNISLGVNDENKNKKNNIQTKEDFTLLKVFPHTGRTHQIRVHMKFINHPLVGDKLYGPKKENPFGFTRSALHAHFITFKDVLDKEHSVEAPYPEDIRRIIENLRLKI